MKGLRDLKDLTIHDVEPISDEYVMLQLKKSVSWYTINLSITFSAGKSPGASSW